MNLPNRKNAFVPKEKIIGYLLSESHPSGKAKAKFLRGAGFHNSNVEVLEQELISIAQSQDVIEVVQSNHGTKFVVDGMLQTPSNEEFSLRTIWIIDGGKDTPRFVTAYPK
jgi:hypothetical protein